MEVGGEAISVDLSSPILYYLMEWEWGAVGENEYYSVVFKIMCQIIIA